MKIEIPVAVYSTEITFYTDAKEFHKALGRTGGQAFRYVTVERVGGDIWVLVQDTWNDTTCPPFIAILSHEMNHAAMCILHDLGIPFDYKHQEVLCYLQEYLMRQVLDGLGKANDE